MENTTIPSEILGTVDVNCDRQHLIFPVYLKSKNGFFKKANNPETKEAKMAG